MCGERQFFLVVCLVQHMFTKPLLLLLGNSYLYPPKILGTDTEDFWRQLALASSSERHKCHMHRI
jgi:hypothetical protein